MVVGQERAVVGMGKDKKILRLHEYNHSLQAQFTGQFNMNYCSGGRKTLPTGS